MTKKAGVGRVGADRLHSGLRAKAMAMSDVANWTPAMVPHSASQSPMRRHPPNAMATGPRRIQAATNARTRARREGFIECEYIAATPAMRQLQQTAGTRDSLSNRAPSDLRDDQPRRSVPRARDDRGTH